MWCYEEGLHDHHEAGMLPQVISVCMLLIHSLVLHLYVVVNVTGIGTYLAAMMAVQPSHVKFKANVGSRCCVD